MIRLSPPTRIAICLAFLSVNVLLCAQIFGLIPGFTKPKREQALRAAMSARFADMAKAGNLNGIKAGAATLLNNLRDVEAVQVHRADGTLIAEVGALKDADTQVRQVGRDETSQLVVPIVVDGRTWGHADVFLRRAGARGWLAVATHPLIVLIAFVASLTFLVSLAYVQAALWHDPTMVVPDHVRTALDALTEGLLLLDNRGEVTYANQAFIDIVQTAPKQLIGMPAHQLAWFPVHQKQVEFPWERLDDKGRAEGVLGLSDRDGHPRTFLVRASRVLDHDAQERGVMVSFDDVTALERKKAELGEMLKLLKKLKQTGEESRRRTQELEILATQDPLTSCLNRRAFFTEFESQWNASERYGHPLSFVMLDIDRFKSVNDQFGHSTGDLIIREVAATLLNTVRDFDAVCRYGGEEFCILLPHVDVKGAVEAAERCRGFIESLEMEQGIRITASLGVSSRNFGSLNTQELLEQADQCLYLAKHSGRNKVVSWEDVPDEVREGTAEVLKRFSTLKQKDAPVPFHAVAALISALHFRDPETADHCRRVADLCVATAEGLMSEADRYLLEIAALLHDIGKLGVPESILMKEAPLSDDEWKQMRTHVLIGVEILATSLGSTSLTEIVGAHHAWYGGNPNDQRTPTGSEIPVAARILSIADAFDSMVSDRPYRKGMSREDAFGELRRCTQSQFDPELVERFINSVLEQDSARRDPLDHVSKRAALNIGLQMEKLICALDAEDTITICKMASQLRMTAGDTGATDIAKAATQLETAVGYEPDWKLVGRLTNELLDICRSTQQSYLHADDDLSATIP